jgi:hypothetical protein
MRVQTERKIMTFHQTAANERRASRQAIEDEIERLIALLDHIDGDPDIEEDDPLESTLGDYSQDLELDTADFEPWLGWGADENQDDLGNSLDHGTGVAKFDGSGRRIAQAMLLSCFDPVRIGVDELIPLGRTPGGQNIGMIRSPELTWSLRTAER